MKKFNYLFFVALFSFSILHSALVRANNGKDRDFKQVRERERSEKGDRDGLGARGGDQASPRGSSSDEGGARVPLDGGLSILLAAGIGLGVKKMVEKNKARKEAGGDYAA
jgi:hypothetical protein